LFFDDLAFFNSRVPMKREEWARQPKAVIKNLALAQPLEFNATDARPQLVMKLYRSSEFKLAPGDRFRMFRRFIDFNSPKILNNFLEIDKASRTENSFFLKLLENPKQEDCPLLGDHESSLREELRLNRMYRELRDLGNSDAKLLVFQKSQQHAMRSILKRKATIIWGPPGTGKTHTLALAALYLLEILYVTTKDNVVVWMTAVTNAAINTFIKKFQFLKDRIQSIPNIDKSWLKELQVNKLDPGSKHALGRKRLTLIAGTVWQLWNRNKTTQGGKLADVLIIDEAGQMNVGTSALAIRWLNETGRLVGI
jgi:AAA domain